MPPLLQKLFYNEILFWRQKNPENQAPLHKQSYNAYERVMSWKECTLNWVTSACQLIDKRENMWVASSNYDPTSRCWDFRHIQKAWKLSKTQWQGWWARVKLRMVEVSPALFILLHLSLFSSKFHCIQSRIFEADPVNYNPATPLYCWTPRKVPKCEKPGCWGSQLKSRRPCRSHLSWSAPPCLTCSILPSRPPKYTKCYWSLPPTWWKEKSHPRLRKYPFMWRVKF